MSTKVVAPETILDHVIAYTIGAGEVIQESMKNQLRTTSRYDMTLIPYGPPFYTAILQAAGALSIKKETETALIIYQQSQSPKHIIVSQKDIGPILGKTFSFPQALTSVFCRKNIKASETIDENIENQIYFIRILSDIKHIITIGVGESVEKEEVTKLIADIQKKLSTITFFVANLTRETEFEQCRKDDEKIISHIISRKLKSTADDSKKIPELFSDISKKLKRVPEIVAYSNTGDLGGNKKKTNGYACLIA